MINRLPSDTVHCLVFLSYRVITLRHSRANFGGGMVSLCYILILNYKYMCVCEWRKKDELKIISSHSAALCSYETWIYEWNFYISRTHKSQGEQIHRTCNCCKRCVSTCVSAQNVLRYVEKNNNQLPQSQKPTFTDLTWTPSLMCCTKSPIISCLM